MANPEFSQPVLVAYASRHGATREIAQAIGSALAEAGVANEVRDVVDVGALSGYGAVILGSAVYMGRWVKDAREFAEAHSGELGALPLWLFSSGPLDGHPEPKDSPFGVDDLVRDLNARGHHVFSGKADLSELGFGERTVLRMVKAEAGDFRDWQDIGGWAADIATAMAEGVS